MYANAFVDNGDGLQFQFYEPNDVVVYACETGFTSQSANAAITCTCDINNSAQWICDPPADANSEPCQPSNNPSKFFSVFRLLMCEHNSNTLLFYKSNFI